jgi:hypothetical protein
MTITFTPGPWFVRAAGLPTKYIIETADRATVATAYYPGDGTMIAAAPDMLAALKIADIALRAHGAGSSWDREQVLAAIAKAKGVQS